MDFDSKPAPKAAVERVPESAPIEKKVEVVERPTGPSTEQLFLEICDELLLALIKQDSTLVDFVVVFK